MSASADPAPAARLPGWRALVPAALLLALGAALLPLLLTPVLPVRDGYLHAVRYLVLSGRPLPPALEASYLADWRLLPNLGMDVVGAGLMRLMEPLAAMRAVGALTILAPLGGVMALSAALHGRPTPVAALLGGVLAVNHVTIWGFTNFLVGLGLALGGLALWIALAPRPRAQMAAALLFGPVLLMVHGLAFALWGLLLGAVEIAAAWQARASGGLAPLALARRTARLLTLAALPVLLWSLMPTGGAQTSVTTFFAPAALDLPLLQRLAAEAGRRLTVALLTPETGWDLADPVLGAALWSLLAWGLRSGALVLHPSMVPAALGAGLLVLLCPSYVLGVAFVADRMPLVLACVLAAGCRVRPGAPGRAALAGLALLLLADAALTAASWRAQGRHYAAFLADPALRGLSGTAVLLQKGAVRGGGAGLACDPLAPLLALTGDVAVPTFDDPTQQPLRMTGALKAPWEAFFAMDGLPASGRALLDLGFDHVIACDGSAGAGAAPLPDEGRVLARGARWYVLGRPEG